MGPNSTADSPNAILIEEAALLTGGDQDIKLESGSYYPYHRNWNCTTQELHLPTVTGVSAVRILERGNATRHLGASVLCTCAARANAGFGQVAFDACTLR